MRAKCILGFLLIGLFLLIASACQPQVPAGKKTIVVTYSILGSVVKEMVGDSVNVVVSVPNGLDPHDWEPSARDIEAINKADLVIENGLGLEGGLGKTLNAARSRGVKFFTAADHVTVRHVGPGEGIPSGDPDQVVGAPDPHLWTDPLTMKEVVSALAPALMKDPGLDVSARAKELEQRLEALNGEANGIISPIPEADRKLVTGHESMGYFAQRYRFKLIGVIVPSLSSQAGASAAALAALKQAIRENHVKAVFAEVGTSPAVAKAISDETGVKVVQLTTHALPADGSYFTFMRNLATVIADALK
ncbi:MAG: metal ABC transporter substrate-binding protein [Dehalococcoidales bacterium]|nr:metal ABC transporter substrate-binding protein [Dehalococcoidales bacterium]